MRKLKHKLIALTLILFNLAIMSTSALSANVPCNVQLEFDSNSKGSVANYVLSLQLKNTTGRQVIGASVLYGDANNHQLGNAMPLQQVDDMLHDRPIDQGDHRLGHADG